MVDVLDIPSMPRSWIPNEFQGWTTSAPIVDTHVHVNAGLGEVRTFCEVASKFNVKTVGAIVHGASWFKSLPMKRMGHYYIPFHSFEQATNSGDYSVLDDMKQEGAVAIKFWFATRYFRGKKRIDTPEFARFLREVGKHGLVVAIHVSDPTSWHGTKYREKTFGTKEFMREQVLWLVGEAPETTFLLVHMGGNPENPQGLSDELDAHQNMYLDTSATKWVSRELSRHHGDAVALFHKHDDRILFGTDIVIPPHNAGAMNNKEYYVSRYLVQRMMLEHDGAFNSPIPDPDNKEGMPLQGLGLNETILDRVYRENARSIFQRISWQE
ncbi:amidohydrolase family protein [Candidatus Bathyarchaeota archaeon]|nr:amidohydrolase family protein [Candidatus Bathyarchaeota archaeon]